jgi:hypothetical protein
MQNNSPPDDLGPKISPELAANIKRMVKQKIAEIEQPSGKPKGKTVVGKQKSWPKYFCGICQAMSREKYPVGVELMPKEKDCADCREMLDQGTIALFSPDGRYAFAYNSELASTLEQERIEAVKLGKEAPPVDRRCIGNAEMSALEEHIKSQQKN